MFYRFKWVFKLYWANGASELFCFLSSSTLSSLLQLASFGAGILCPNEGPCDFPGGDDRGCLYNHNFVQTYSLLWNVCPVSHVASWPLISLIWRRSLRWPFTVDPLCGASTRAWNYPRQFELMAYYKIITTQHHVCQRSKTWHLNRCFVFTITVNITRPC